MLRHALVLLASASFAAGLVAPASVIAAPTARYSYSPANPVAGQTMMFDGSASSCDRTPCSYRWQDDGPDGPGGANTALGTGIRVSHIFLQAGAKYVRLTVTNRRRRSSSIVKTINVAAPLPSPAPACSDGQDNDADGRTDYPADPGCDSPQDGTESPDPPPADTDRALNRPATASSHEQPPLYEPRLAIDGDPATRWSSNYVDGQWWQVDLGGYYAVERVELNWEVAYALSYRIQVSDNGLVFTTVASPTISAAGHHVHSFAPTRARYVRVLGVTRATPWGISLFDAEVYGQPTDTPPLPRPPQCSDGVDNTDPEDTLVDLADPGCAGAADDDETDPPPPPPNPQVGLAQPDGGPNYYGRFSNPLPTTPDYFPIGVWGAYKQNEQVNRDLDAAAGLNTYVWLADPCNTAPAIRADGRFRVIHNQGENRSCIGPETAGWMLPDEIDMSEGPSACNGTLQNILNGLPQDGRFRYTNYGKGVIFWETDAQAACFVNKQDVTSDDIYWLSDTNSCTSSSEGPRFFNLPAPLPDSICRRPANYGHTVDKMRRLDAMDGERQPIWNFVETAQQGNRKPLAPEIRAAVWHSLIAGARGIIYFQHAWAGTCAGDHHTIRSNCEGTRQVVVDTNAQVKSLAPVLNAPTVSSGTSSSGPVRAMVKWQGGSFYVFAGSTGAAGTGTVSIPCVGNATAARLGEAGSVPVTSGSFTDSFADRNSVHIYRLDGGSRCGL